MSSTKDHVRHLHQNLPEDAIALKCDFIQNIVHSRGRETAQSYYGKRQSQFLSFVAWCYTEELDGRLSLQKLNFDYLSSFLKHNSLFFQKCLLHLLVHLRDSLGVEFRKV